MNIMKTLKKKSSNMEKSKLMKRIRKNATCVIKMRATKKKDQAREM